MDELIRCETCGSPMPTSGELGRICPRCLLSLASEPDDEDPGGHTLPDAERDDGDAKLKPGATIGHYRILRLVGEGGMGRVYEALQEQPGRKVALKIIKPGMVSLAMLRRFEQESEALGRLQHPGIAQIYDAGTADAGYGPQPYFAMEFIRGETLREYADGHRLPLRDRLEIMVRVCDAVHHAHQRGLIHRDLKPGNILIDEAGQPKVLDFGVARVTDCDTKSTLQTGMGQLVGTLAYMSPEQVLADPLELDTRSDVYALGVILYELLSSRLPYSIGKTIPEALQAIREEDPARLSSINRTYRGDIETIVAKALEKDKTRRYSSAAELGADIERYLKDQPIVARPASATYQLQKFARRHKALVIGMATVFVVLSAGVVTSTWQAVRATSAEQLALAETDKARLAVKEAQEQRDRANANEMNANVERERAVEAERRAQTERNNALAETERADSETAIATAVQDFLGNDLLRMASPFEQSRSSPPNPDISVREVLNRASKRIGNRFEKQPLVEARIREIIAEIYYELGDKPAVREQLERAIELRRREQGSAHSQTLFWTMRLAAVIPDPEQRDILAKRVMEDGRRGFGDDSPAMRRAISMLVNFHIGEERRLPEGENFLKDLIDYDRRKFGDDNSATRFAISDLVRFYTIQRRPRIAEAETFLEQLFEEQRRRLGDANPATLFTASLLSNLYVTQPLPKYAAAEILIKSALETARRKHGNGSRAVRDYTYELANVYFKQNKNRDAESLLVTLVSDSAVNRILQGGTEEEENRRVLGSIELLLQVYAKLGKTQQTDDLARNLRSVLEILMTRSDLSSSSGASDFKAGLITMGTVALRDLRQGRIKEAEGMLRTTLEGYRRVARTDPDSRDITGSLIATAWVELEGMDNQAEGFIRELLDIQRSELGDQNLDTFNTMSLLAGMYFNHQKYPEAIDVYSNLIAFERKALGPTVSTTLTSMMLLSWAYPAQFSSLLAKGQPEQARLVAEKGEAYYRQYLAVHRSAPGEENSQRTRFIAIGLASVCAALGKYADAEVLYNEVMALQQRAANVPQSVKLTSVANIGWLQFRQQKYAEAGTNLRAALSAYEQAQLRSWERYNTESMLGATLAAQGKYSEAESYLVRGYEQTLHLTPAQGAYFLPVLFIAEAEPGERILKLYRDWGKPEKVAEWRQKVRGAPRFGLQSPVLLPVPPRPVPVPVVNLPTR